MKEEIVLSAQSILFFAQTEFTFSNETEFILPFGMEDAVRAQREIDFFLQKKGASGTEIVKRLKNVFEDRSLSKTAVCKWMERFSGDENITCKDGERTGRPRTSKTAETCEKVFWTRV